MAGLAKGRFLWESEADFQFLSREETDRLQEQAVLEHVNYCLENSPFYNARAGERLGGKVREVASLDQLPGLGFTTKDDLLKYNDAFLAVPRADIVDTCFTSATEGTSPVNFLLTKSDLDRLAYNESVAFHIAGLTREDTMAVCVALERGFMAGLAYFLGGVKLGMHMIRIGASGSGHVWNLIRTYRPTAIIGVPSVMGGIAADAVSEGGDPSSLGVKKLLAIGEPIRNRALDLLPSSERIERLWKAPLFSTYASTEMASTFCECEKRLGGHFRPELIYVEILDDNGDRAADGEPGEVVVTPLGVRGMPLVRFKTGDISCVISEKCPCGRATRRIGPVLGRKSQQLKYRGTTIFPNAIVSVVEANPDFAGCYVEVFSAGFGEDRVVAVIAPSGDQYDLDRLKDQFRAGLRVVPELRISTREELTAVMQPPGKRKRQIFFDKRKEV